MRFLSNGNHPQTPLRFCISIAPWRWCRKRDPATPDTTFSPPKKVLSDERKRIAENLNKNRVSTEQDFQLILDI